jgi:perosamine synthetase
VRGWFVWVVQLPRDADRDATILALRELGVQSKPYLPAIHLMSFYKERFGHAEGEFPVCEDVAARSLALPFFPEMQDDEVAQVADALERVLRVPARTLAAP